MTALLIAGGTVLLTPNERRVAEDRPVCRSTGRRDCYWLYVVTSYNVPRLPSGADQKPRSLPVARS